MTSALTAAEREYLTKRFDLLFRQVDSRPSDQPQDMRVDELLDPEKGAAYLDWLGGRIGSPSRRVTASTLAKRYAFVAISPVLYAMTVYNKGLSLSLERCTLQTSAGLDDHPGGTKLPRLGLTACHVTEPMPGQRNEWREKLVHGLFAGHLTPVFHALSEIAKVPKVILWENAVVRIVPLFEDALEKAADETAACRIREDFHYIAHDSAGIWYGERRNPLSKLIGPLDLEADDERGSWLRRTCCLYYEISAEYCRLCPIPGFSRK